MVRKTIFFILAVFSATMLPAQTVRVMAPDSVSAGDRFRVSYIIENCNLQDFQNEAFKGCIVLSGPSTSTQSSYSIVNGKRTQTTSVTLTYYLQAQTSMSFSPSPCTLTYDGKVKKVALSEMQIEPTELNGTPRSLTTVADDDLFIRVSASKKQIYQKETVVVTYKLYTRVDVKDIVGRLPQPDGCYYQELSDAHKYFASQEVVDGKVYSTSIWRQFMLIPSDEGKISVPAANLEAEVLIADYSNYNPFDFFGSGASSRSVSKSIIVPGFEIDVKPLPEPRPKGFSGAVGNYSITSQLTYGYFQAGDSIQLRFILSGQGNMNLMKAPVFDFPENVEVYNQSNVQQNGYRGSVIYDYLVVPRKAGDYVVPSVEYVYFDPDKARYITIKTDQFHIQVE